MLIGVPKEVKAYEFRVGLTATSVKELVGSGHTVLVQAGAGDGIGQDDAVYRRAGATVVDGAKEVYGQADLIVKVKEPQPSEYDLLRAGQVLMTYLHLAPDRQQATALLASGCVAIAYETVTDAYGGLPLLTPMSEVAGCLSVQVGAYYLQRLQGGAGLLLGGGARGAGSRRGGARRRCRRHKRRLCGRGPWCSGDGAGPLRATAAGAR